MNKQKIDYFIYGVNSFLFYNEMINIIVWGIFFSISIYFIKREEVLKNLSMKSCWTYLL